LKKAKKQQLTGNRCGHDKANPRFCDLTRKGKGGHPPAIGMVVSLLQQSYRDRKKLITWQKMNPSGRRRRTDGCEPMIALNQFMFSQWFQLDTRRCAVSSGFFLQVPDVKHLARKISQTKQWADARLSEGRIHTVFSDFEKCGYIRSKQVKVQKSDGSWASSPSIRVYTKKFFLELGGQALWQRIFQSGQKKLDKIKPIATMCGLTLKQFLAAEEIATPRKINYYKQLGMNANPLFLSQKKKYEGIKPSTPCSPDIRETIEYKRVMAEKVEQLFMTHPPDDPRKTHWPLEELKDNARRITDKIFNISAA
jgi:hypothetical protein